VRWDATRPRLATLGLVLAPLAVQLGILLVRSHQQYGRYNLSLDFALFHQAWHQIATGDLNPELTPFGYPYWRSHFELVMWLLAPLHWLHPQGIVLLWMQDVATVAAEAVALWWAAGVLERRWPDGGLARSAVLVVVAVLAAANPWIYLASVQDFHLEALGALFAVLAARDLWAGRTRRAVVWIALTLSTGDVSATYVAGIGLSVILADRRRWRLGLGLVTAGAGWVALVAALHAGLGSGLDTYAHLIGRPVDRGLAGALTIAGGVLLHPGKALSLLWERRGDLLQQLVPTGGILALAAPWALGVMAIVLLANGLNRNPFYAHPAYPGLPVFVFGVTGICLAIEWVARRSPWRAATALALTAAVAAGALHLAVTRDVIVDRYHVDRATAADLDGVRRRLPAGAEVVSSFGVAGRFADRRYLYLHSRTDQVFPVRAARVAFVFAPSAGNQSLPHDEVASTATALRDRLGAQVLADGPRVYAYLWTPAPGVAEVRLSPAP
jgi:hypothetical protein